MNVVQQPVPPLSNELIAKFRAIVGDKYAVTDQADIAPYTTEERDLFRGRSPLVLRPGSTDEVSAIRICIDSLLGHDLFRKPVPTFRDHALLSRHTAGADRPRPLLDLALDECLQKGR